MSLFFTGSAAAIRKAKSMVNDVLEVCLFCVCVLFISWASATSHRVFLLEGVLR